MEEAEAEGVALPKAWRTFEQLKSQVISPCCVRQGVPIKTTLDGTQYPVATVILHHFFTEPPCRKRGQGAATDPPGSQNNLKGKRKDRKGRHNVGARAAPANHTPALRRAVNAAVQSVRASIGNVETVDNNDAVVVLFAVYKPVAGRPSSTSRAGTSTQKVFAWHISGLCICEPVQCVYRAAPSPVSRPSPSSALLNESEQKCSTTGVICSSAEQVTHVGDAWCPGITFCGIKLLWVSVTMRGRGVAYALVEAARRSLCYGYDVPAEHVAFSEPTLMGSRFARRYQQRNDVLVYGLPYLNKQ